MGHLQLQEEEKDKLWGNSHESRFQKLLDSGFLSDLQICVNAPPGDLDKRRIFKVHKLIIATGSPVLYEKLCVIRENGHRHHEGEDVIHLENIDTDIFQIFLKFLYTGTVDLRMEDALPLLKLAEENSIPDLMEKCKALLREKLTDEIAITIYQQAIHFRNQPLLDKTHWFICRNAWSILEHESFTTLKAENLKRLLESEELLVLNETQLLKALYRWGEHECKRNNGSSVAGELKEFLKWISWGHIEPEMIQNAPELQKLFSAHNSMFEEEAPKRWKCKFHSRRKYFEDEGASFLMSRLPQKFAYCTDNQEDKPEEIIRFKTDMSISLLSIGIPAYSQTCEDVFDVRLEIRDINGKSLVNLSQIVPHSKEIYHLIFKRPCKIIKDTWYTIVASVKGVPGYGNTGGKSISYAKINLSKNGKETNVKFEFKNVSTSSPESDHVSQGQIDEFCFKLVED